MPQRKFLTVMFADLCDSTKLVSGVDPEEAQARLALPIEIMSEAVQEFGGTISQVNGDGILALFGAPVAQEDHALRACLAASAIHQRIRAFTANSRPTNVRIGIDSGEVFVGTVREYLSQHYRADGDTVHIAKRLETLAKPGTALMTEATRQLAGPGIETSLLGWRKIRGLDSLAVSPAADGPEGVTGSAGALPNHAGRRKLFTLVTAGRVVSEPVAKSKPFAPMVGREQLMQSLRDAVGECLEQNVHAIGIEGSAGMGKSRLLEAIAEELPARGFRVLSIAPRAYSENLAYSLTSVLLGGLVSSRLPATTADQGDLVETLMMAWPDDSKRHRLAIADVLGRKADDSSWLSLTPAQKHRQIADALAWSIERETDHGPIAILIDDLHLGDLVSLKLLSQVVPRVRKKALLFLSTFRPGLSLRGFTESWFARWAIEPLSSEDMTTLARSLLGSHASIETPLKLAVERALGNPFFLEQLVMNLIDEGSLVGRPGNYRCYRSFAKLAIPASIAAVVSALVDRLSLETRETLEAAAILGDPIRIEVLAAMRNIGSKDAASHLSNASAAGLLRVEDARSYFFRHALIRELVVSPLPQNRRKSLHSAAFTVMEAKFGGEADFGPVLATLAFRGDLWVQAATYAAKTMSRSISRFANRDAISMFNLGLEAVGQCGKRDAAHVRAELLLRSKVLGAMMTLGQLSEVAANLERARELARELNDAESEAASALQLATICWTNGEYRKGLEAAQSAALVAAASGKRNLQLAALQARMMLSHGQGRYAETARSAREALTQFVPELAMQQMLPGWVINAKCNALIFLADCYWRMEEGPLGQATLDEAYAILGQNDHIFTRLLADFVQGEMWVAVGKSADAVPWLEDALLRCQQHDVPTMYPAMLAFYGMALAQSGRATIGLATLSRAYDEGTHKAGGRYNDYYFPRSIAICHLELGRPQAALEWARTAREAAAGFEQGGNVADAMHVEGRALAALDRVAEAVVCFEEALERAEACSMRLTANRLRSLILELRPDAAEIREKYGRILSSTEPLL